MAETIGRLRDDLARAPQRAVDFFGQNFPEAEAAAISDKIEVALNKADTRSYRNNAETEMKDLDPSVAGQFHVASKAKSMDKEFLLGSTAMDIAHVLYHESLHEENALKASGVRITEVGFEEGITEAATVQGMNDNAMAYQTETAMVKKASKAVAGGINTVIGWYRAGDNESINDLIAEASNDNGGSDDKGPTTPGEDREPVPAIAA